jgi:hypothetical protein
MAVTRRPRRELEKGLWGWPRVSQRMARQWETTIHVNHGKLNGGAVQIGSIPKAVRLRELRELKVQNAGTDSIRCQKSIPAIPRALFDLRDPQSPQLLFQLL